MLEPQLKSAPTTCPLGMAGGGLHTIAIRRQRDIAGFHTFCMLISMMLCVPVQETSRVTENDEGKIVENWELCSYHHAHHHAPLYLYRVVWCHSMFGPWCR